MVSWMRRVSGTSSAAASWTAEARSGIRRPVSMLQTVDSVSPDACASASIERARVCRSSRIRAPIIFAEIIGSSFH